MKDAPTDSSANEHEKEEERGGWRQVALTKIKSFRALQQLLLITFYVVVDADCFGCLVLFIFHYTIISLPVIM